MFFAPEGAYGKDGITHGALIGLFTPNARDLASANKQYVDGLLQGNSYLRRQGNSSGVTMGGRSALMTQLYGTSPVTGRTENVTISSVMVSDGRLLYFVGVSPQSDAVTYDRVFGTMRGSIRIND